MIALVLFLIIIPYLYGQIFIEQKNGFGVLAIPCGLMVELVLWTFASLPIVFLRGHFSTSVHIYLGINILIVIWRCIVLIKQYGIGGLKDKLGGCLREYARLFKSAIFIAMFVVVLFQCARSTFFQQSYGDNRVYVAIANDIVETNSYYTIDETYGEVREDSLSAAKKYVLSTWYSYEAFLSEVSDMEPLMMIYTILPGYLLALSYMVWWYLSGVFLNQDKEKMSLFILLLALFYEFNAEDVSSYLLNWPTYGKNITASLVMPLLILFWIRYCRSGRRIEYWYMILLMTAGCVASTMGIMLLSIEMSFLNIIYVVMKKKFNKKLVLRYIGLMLPVLVYGMIYIGM